MKPKKDDDVGEKNDLDIALCYMFAVINAATKFW